MLKRKPPVKSKLLLKLKASARRKAVKQKKRALKLELQVVMAQVAGRGVTVVLLFGRVLL